MERDEELRQILFNSAEPASPGFTESVMQRVNVLSARPLYQPIVSSRLKKLFLATFATITTAIVIICLIMTFDYSTITRWLQSIKLPEINYYKVLFFIVSFWIVFAANALMGKKILARGSSF